MSVAGSGEKGGDVIQVMRFPDSNCRRTIKEDDTEKEEAEAEAEEKESEEEEKGWISPKMS